MPSPAFPSMFLRPFIYFLFSASTDLARRTKECKKQGAGEREREGRGEEGRSGYISPEKFPSRKQLHKVRMGDATVLDELCESGNVAEDGSKFHWSKLSVCFWSGGPGKPCSPLLSTPPNRWMLSPKSLFVLNVSDPIRF